MRVARPLRALLPLGSLALSLAAVGCGPTAVQAPVEGVPHPPERTDDGEVRLRVVQGELVGLPGPLLLAPGPTRFLVDHDAEGAEVEEIEGQELRAAAVGIWGRGEARPLLPSGGSPMVRLDSQELWEVDLRAGVYELSLTAGADPVGSVGPPVVVVVR